MKHRRFIRRFQDWHEGLVGEDERREIQRHLDECGECKRYFEKMTWLMEGIDSARLPHLEPDPFLPARIRATGAGERSLAGGVSGLTAWARPLFGRLGVWVLTAAVAVALAVGAFLGSELSSLTVSRTADAARVDA
jgi:anti-sigma factor RsiW